MEREKREKQGRLLAGCLYLLYGAACCFLYYHMCLPEKGKYHSDLPAHIQSGMNGEAYSLLEILYKYICRAGFGSKVIPVLLTVLTLAAVYLSFPDHAADCSRLEMHWLCSSWHLQRTWKCRCICRLSISTGIWGFRAEVCGTTIRILACGYLDCWCCFVCMTTKRISCASLPFLFVTAITSGIVLQLF